MRGGLKELLDLMPEEEEEEEALCSSCVRASLPVRGDLCLSLCLCLSVSVLTSASLGSFTVMRIVMDPDTHSQKSVPWYIY